MLGMACKAKGVIPTHVGRILVQSGVYEVTGLSPHTWGKHHDKQNSAKPDRAIPTHVGQFPAAMLMKMAGRAIPTHVGQFPAAMLMKMAGRAIPTHVGQIRRAIRAPRPEASHPHARGENDRAAIIRR